MFVKVAATEVTTQYLTFRNLYIHSCIHTYIHTYTYIHIHTYIHIIILLKLAPI